MSPKKRGRGRPKKKQNVEKKQNSSGKKKRKRRAVDESDVDDSLPLTVTDPIDVSSTLVLVQPHKNQIEKARWHERLIVLGSKYVLLNEDKALSDEPETKEFEDWCKVQNYFTKCKYEDGIRGVKKEPLPKYFASVLTFIRKHFVNKVPGAYTWKWKDRVPWYIDDLSMYVLFPDREEVDALLQLVHRVHGIYCNKPDSMISPENRITRQLRKKPRKSKSPSERFLLFHLLRRLIASLTEKYF